MTALEAIDRLIEAVITETLDAYTCGACGSAIQKYCNGETITFLTPLDAYSGDLNAAKCLKEALLPKGWGAQVTLIAGEQGSFAKVYPPSVLQGGKGEATCLDPARALLLAILRAHRHQIAAGGE